MPVPEAAPAPARMAVAPASADTPQEIVLWDVQRVSTQPEASLFDAQCWRDRGQIARQAEGRGTAHFLHAAAGENWVLRHYQRGGLIARINHDRYLWSGADATRPAREFRLLAALYNRGLPVPRPVAARAVRRAGMAYTADLITEAIPGTRPLADHLTTTAMDEAEWRQLGAVIAGLHRAGIWHADLNARNILISQQPDFHLIDFDRARPRRGKAWWQANLKRLHRSLDKFAGRWPVFHFADRDWRALLEGYASICEMGAAFQE